VTGDLEAARFVTGDLEAARFRDERPASPVFATGGLCRRRRDDCDARF
jgi:hypothetical protein